MGLCLRGALLNCYDILASQGNVLIENPCTEKNSEHLSISKITLFPTSWAVPVRAMTKITADAREQQLPANSAG